MLGREKFAKHAAEGRATAFVAVLLDRGEMVEDGELGPERTADPDDDYLISLAQKRKRGRRDRVRRPPPAGCRIERPFGADAARDGRSPRTRIVRLNGSGHLSPVCSRSLTWERGAGRLLIVGSLGAGTSALERRERVLAPNDQPRRGARPQGPRPRPSNDGFALSFCAPSCARDRRGRR